MKFKKGKKYRIIKLDEDARENGSKYDATYSHMTRYKVIFDKVGYEVNEFKATYKITWKVEEL